MFFSLSCGVCVGLVLCVRPPIIESDSHHKDFCLGVWRANGQGVQAGAAKYNFSCLRVHFFVNSTRVRGLSSFRLYYRKKNKKVFD